ncbi:MAG: antitoxin [Coxiella sp. (in: Bacteria)]|nr:MAG: antitoxin [Coxiella sp. (in: g-proteobacteria)]
MRKQTKLTLRIDEELIKRAKRYSKASGKSVSSIVADYFALLGVEAVNSEDELPDIVRSLIGVIKANDIDEDDYRKHLEDKYL